MPVLSNHSDQVAAWGEAGDDSAAISDSVTPAVMRNFMGQHVFHLSTIKDDNDIISDALHVPTSRIDEVAASASW
jgi:hypothetical protein